VGLVKCVSRSEQSGILCGWGVYRLWLDTFIMCCRLVEDWAGLSGLGVTGAQGHVHGAGCVGFLFYIVLYIGGLGWAGWNRVALVRGV